MVFSGCIDAKRRAYIAFWHEKGIATSEIMKRCQVSRTTVYRIKKESFLPDENNKKRCAGGRPNKLCARDERKLIQRFHALRKEEGQFSSNRLMQQAGLKDTEVSNQTVHRFLHKNGYHYLQARKKGLMTQCNMNKNIQQKFTGDIWKTSIAFYLDGVSFYHKTNPADQARAPKGRVWREKSKRLKQGCLAKGSKEGNGDRVLSLMVAISYGKGVIECHKYSDLDSNCFAKFINKTIDMFAKAGKNGSRLFVQDNASTQNSALVRKVMPLKRAKQLQMPARSPHVNPIVNLFNLIKVQLRRQALERNHFITHETFEQLSMHVIRTMYNFPVDIIDKIIATMAGCMGLIITGKGEHTKY